MEKEQKQILTNITNGYGEGKEYNIYGKLEFEGEYKDGNKFKGKEYCYKNFKYDIKYIDEYKEIDTWVGKEYYDYDKKIIYFEGKYKNGLKQKGREYYNTGEITFEGEYKNGKKRKGKNYDKYGELYYEGEYKNEHYYNEEFWIGHIYKDPKIIGTYKNGKKLEGYINLKDMKNGIIFDDGNEYYSGKGEEYIYDELIFK